MDLSKEIKNPKEFMASRNKSNEIYMRKSTIGRRLFSASTVGDSDTDRGSDSARSLSETDKRRSSTMGMTDTKKVMSNTEYSKQRE